MRYRQWGIVENAADCRDLCSFAVGKTTIVELEVLYGIVATVKLLWHFSFIEYKC